MLIISALLSIGLIACIFFSHRKQTSPVWTSFLFAAGGTGLGVVCFLPALLLHAALVFLGTLVWKLGGWGSPSFLMYMVLAGIGSYGSIAYQQIAQHQRLRDQYPIESMESRVRAPKIAISARSSKETESHLTQLEQKLNQEGENDFRRSMLQRLHHESLETFINSPGFGQMRGIRPTEWSLKMGLRRDENPIPQPDTPSSSTLSETDIALEPSDAKSESLCEMHLSSVFDFVNPNGFGWVVNRQKVAGFRPHHFSAVPQTKQWKIRAVELVGILLHEQPIVYVSNELPSMDKLRKVPTRTLNTFEEIGLQKLQQGDEMFVRETSQDIRMLGAVRSIEQCVKCHGGERGDLLGAFSYSLLRSGSDAERGSSRHDTLDVGGTLGTAVGWVKRSADAPRTCERIVRPRCA